MNENKTIKGYVMLPCFTVERREDDNGHEAWAMTCNKFLAQIFVVFFAPLWNGKIHYKDGE